MQEYRYKDSGCLYLGRLMKMMMSRDFGRVSVWYFFLRLLMAMTASIYKNEEAVIAENRLDFMGIMTVEGRIWLVTVMSE